MFISNRPEETIAAGRAYGQNARKGDVFALTGDLGSGKTQFVRGVVAGLKCNADVSSPTFVLVHEYAGGRLPIFHLDLYRIENKEDLLRLGFDDYVFGDGVTLIEWADRFPELIPKGAKWIAFGIESENARTISLETPPE